MKKKSTENHIYLEDFCTRIGSRASKVFTGRDRGIEVREKSNIDALYNTYHSIIIEIPEGTFSITPSFLEEYFVNIVKKYGVETFRNTVNVVANGYEIEAPLEEAIDRIVQRKNALQK